MHYEVKIGGNSVGISRFKDEAERWLHDKPSCHRKELYEISSKGHKVLTNIVNPHRQPSEWANRPKIKQ